DGDSRDLFAEARVQIDEASRRLEVGKIDAAYRVRIAPQNHPRTTAEEPALVLLPDVEADQVTGVRADDAMKAVAERLFDHFTANQFQRSACVVGSISELVELLGRHQFRRS